MNSYLNKLVIHNKYLLNNSNHHYNQVHLEILDIKTNDIKKKENTVITSLINLVASFRLMKMHSSSALTVGSALLKRKLGLTRRTPVTVCIAAVCQGNAIWGASDRMLTSGDGEVEFEPAFPKSFTLTAYIAAMMAGDSGLQAEILQDVFRIVSRRPL